MGQFNWLLLGGSRRHSSTPNHSDKEATMRGSTVTVAFVMALRTADWLRSRRLHKNLGIDAAMGNTALEEEEVCKICRETRTTERVYQIGSVTYTMKHFICKHPRAEKP
jgi:hypothetical protein